MRRSCAEPKFASTSTPTVASTSGTSRLDDADAALPAERDHAGAGADAPLADGAARRSARRARPASAASTCTVRASLSQLSSHSPTTGITTSSTPTRRVGLARRRDGAVEDPADRHRRGEVDGRLDQAPLARSGGSRSARRRRSAPPPRPATGRRKSDSPGPGRIAVTPVRATPRPSGGSGSSRDDGDVADAHARDVGDRVRGAGLEVADAEAVLAQRRLAHAAEPNLGEPDAVGSRAMALVDPARVGRRSPAARAGGRDLGRRADAGRRGARAGRRDPRDAARGRRAEVVDGRPHDDAALEAVHDAGLLAYLASALGRLGGGRAARRPGPGPRRAVHLPAPGADGRARAARAGRDLGAAGRVLLRHDDADRPGHLGGGARRRSTRR